MGLNVRIPPTFPDSFPKIFLGKEDYNKVAPLPHLNDDGSVCTRDPSVCYINEHIPGEAIEYLLHQAISIIETGLQNNKDNPSKNDKYFIEEFKAYWAFGSSKGISLLANIDGVKKVSVYQLSDKLFDCTLVIAENDAIISNWIKSIQANVAFQKKSTAIAVLSNPISPFKLANDLQVYEYLKCLDASVLREVETYFNGHIEKPILILSFNIDDNVVQFGWSHKGWVNVKVKGFSRPNHVTLRERMLSKKNNEIKKLDILQLDKGRLFYRGGAMTHNKLEGKKIAIVGCGSLGSHLAMSLVKSGATNLTLIDNEKLEPENIARHLCGLDYASKNFMKVKAVKEHIQKHFADISITTHEQDILSVIGSSETRLLEDIDYMIVAIAKIN